MSQPLMTMLFDLDGTLLDTAPEFTHCLNILLTQEGKKTIQLEDLKAMVSFGAKGMIEFGFKITDKDPAFTSLKERFLDIYHQHLGFQTQLFPGISDVLQRIQSLGLSWGIVTNKPKAYTFPLLEQFNHFKNTPCVVAGDTLATAKPDPAPLIYACKLLNVSPKNCWYIGDAKTDVQAGHHAGMKCAIANYGYIPKNEDPLNWQADHYLQHANDILALLD